MTIPDLLILALAVWAIVAVVYLLRNWADDEDEGRNDSHSRRPQNFKILPPVYDWAEHEDEVEA